MRSLSPLSGHKQVDSRGGMHVFYQLTTFSIEENHQSAYTITQF